MALTIRLSIRRYVLTKPQTALSCWYLVTHRWRLVLGRNGCSGKQGTRTFSLDDIAKCANANPAWEPSDTSTYVLGFRSRALMPVSDCAAYFPVEPLVMN